MKRPAAERSLDAPGEAETTTAPTSPSTAPRRTSTRSRSGLALAKAYRLPDKIKGPAYHVRVTFHRAFRGPLAIGSGRHRGIGVFAREREVLVPRGPQAELSTTK